MHSNDSWGSSSSLKLHVLTATLFSAMIHHRRHSNIPTAPLSQPCQNIFKPSLSDSLLLSSPGPEIRLVTAWWYASKLLFFLSLSHKISRGEAHNAFFLRYSSQCRPKFSCFLSFVSVDTNIEIRDNILSSYWISDIHLLKRISFNIRMPPFSFPGRNHWDKGCILSISKML
jgi:hypothetical protein